MSWRPLKRQGIGRGMKSDPGRMVGRVALHDDRTLFLFVFTADVTTSVARLICRPRKRCYARGLATNPGSAHKFSMHSIAPTIFTSIVSARSGCQNGHKAGSRSPGHPANSATRLKPVTFP